MDYNYFAEAQPQQYSLFSYGTDLTALSQTVDTTSSTAFSLNTVGNQGILSQSIEHEFDEPLSYDNTMLNMHSSASQAADALTMISHGSIDSTFDLDAEMQAGRRGSSEEKEPVTPAQSRRKAQNRAAQRAFRERKERHVRDLEAKLNLLTTTTSSLQSDNERLKMLLQKVQAENEQLRASVATSPASQPTSCSPEQRPSERSRSIHSAESASGSEALSSSSTAASSRSTTSSSSRQGTASSQLLSASATWDFLQSHPKYVSGVVDIGKVCNRLKKLARADGAGPMFDQEEVRKIIDEVESNGADELL